VRFQRASGSSAVGLYRLQRRARDKLFSLLVGGAFAEYGKRSVLQLPIRLEGERRIAVGNDVFVGAGSWLQVLEGAAGSGAAIEIGDGTSIAGSCVLSAAESIRLGQKVLMARNVYIADHRHAFEDTGTAVLEQGLEQIARVEIGYGAWLGQNVVIGPGVRIGRGAVIGANSVVLSDMPDNSVAVGAPARVVRSLAREAVTPP
jgi:acetyltransferase-like isoleucine patch superfamily enzyme